MCCAFSKAWTTLNSLEIWKACQEERVVLHPVTNLPPLEKSLTASCPLYPCHPVFLDRFWVKRSFLHPGQVAFAGPMVSTNPISEEIRNQNDCFFLWVIPLRCSLPYRPGLQFHRFIGQSVQNCVWLPNPAPESSLFLSKKLTCSFLFMPQV